MRNERATLPIVVLFSALIVTAARAEAQSASSTASTPFPPPQIEMHVPFEPTTFTSARRTYVAYELYLRNFAPIALPIRRVEVLDASGRNPQPIAAFEGAQFEKIIQPVGGARDANSDPGQIGGGRSIVLFIWIASDVGMPLPVRLRHRVVLPDGSIEGAEIGTHHTDLRVLAPPLARSDWIARSGPSNDSYHRRGTLVFNGTPTIDRRYAIDWVKTRNGANVLWR